MATFYLIMQWALILEFIGFIGAAVWLVMAALKLKNGVMGDAKRLYEPPLRSVKSLAAAGKGVAVQETARAKRVGAVVTETVGVVKDTAQDVREAAESVHLADLKPVIANAQYLLKIVGLAAQFTRTAPKQGPSRA